MRFALILALLMAAVPRASADASAMKKARERILEKAFLKAYEDANQSPPITAKAFVPIWRKQFDKLVHAVCACPYESAALVGHASTCVQSAFDDFTLDLVPTMLRLPGMVDAFSQAIDGQATTDEMSKTAQQLTEDALDQAVPPKEQLQRQNKLRSCLEQAGAM